MDLFLLIDHSIFGGMSHSPLKSNLTFLADHQSSEESVGFDPVNSILEEEEEEEEPPRILLYHGKA